MLLGPGALPSGGPRVISFNLDYTLMYIGTYLGSQGRIYTMPLDAQLDPMGPPVEFVSGVGDGQYHDTAGVDICGYLWVANFWDRTLYRISPGGDVLSYWTAPGSTFASDYGHGMKWGTGTNGWDEFKIYMPQPYRNHEVIEVDLGVPSRDWTGGYAINLP